MKTIRADRTLGEERKRKIKSKKPEMETTITDEFMQEKLAASKAYCVMLLRSGPKWNQPGIDKIIWEHGRRSFQLRADAVLSIVCPVVDGGELKGIGVFNASVEETRRIMDEESSFMKRTYAGASWAMLWRSETMGVRRDQVDK